MGKLQNGTPLFLLPSAACGVAAVSRMTDGCRNGWGEDVQLCVLGNALTCLF